MTQLDNDHWKDNDHVQRMTTREWKTFLLSGNDRIIYLGRYVKLKAKNLGCGVVEVRKVFE